MPCMCGDTHCPSCGPAQGNFRCPLCNVWADDGCEHLVEDGNIKSEFADDLKAIEETERLADELYAQQLEEEERLAEEYWRSQE